VYVYSISYPERNAHAPYYGYVAVQGFSTLILAQKDFRKTTLNIKYVLIFPKTFV
jgi:hypothetical protein